MGPGGEEIPGLEEALFRVEQALAVDGFSHRRLRVEQLLGGFFDVTNAYILAGANGCLLTMILFIATIVIAYKAVGRTIRLGEIDRPGSPSLKLVWALGATLFVHTASYISVSYFDQNFVTWFMLLAFISILCGDSLRMPRHEFLAKVNVEADESRPAVPSFGKRDPEPARAPAVAAAQTAAPAPCKLICKTRRTNSRGAPALPVRRYCPPSPE